jgi:hypothetical protein
MRTTILLRAVCQGPTRLLTKIVDTDKNKLTALDPLAFVQHLPSAGAETLICGEL